MSETDTIAVARPSVDATATLDHRSGTNQEANDGAHIGHPTAQLDVEDTAQPNDEDVVYPTGVKVWLAVAAIYTAFFLNGLDITIVAVAVPRLTDYFKKVDDIGWYSAAYGMTASASIPFCGRACTVFTPKSIALTGQIAFLLGSIICTFASQSGTFIFGRAFAGLGASALNASCLTLVTHLFPSHKRSLWLGLAGGSQSIGLSLAPAIGGALIDRFGWRACFGINVPLCSLAIVFSNFFVTDPFPSPGRNAPIVEKIKKLDISGTLVIVPCIICLLLGLQWGGIRYGWSDVRIIALLVVFAILASGFGVLQYRLGERAMVPPKIAKKRSTIAAMWFAACCSGTLAITEYYTSIYWQGVRGDTPTVAGLLSLGLIVGLSLGCIVSGFGINLVGYYTPFMITTSILAPIASGLLTTIDLDESKTKVVAILAILGFGVGLGLNVPFQAMAAILSPQEVSLGIAMVGFAGGLASALFVSASATLFQIRLEDEISKVIPRINSTALSHAGLFDIRGLVGQQNLKDVLTGYNRATVETLYMPLVLSLLTVAGSATMGWVSVKKKRD